jgi:hypothetical protein
MRTVENRIAEMERTIAQLKYELTARKPSREAMPLSPRRGWWLGITRKDYTQGGAAEFIEVDIYLWHPDIEKWRKVTGLPAPGFIQARDWFLNEDEEIEKKTKVRVDYYETTWVVTAAYCSPTDLDEFKPSPGSQSPGEQEQEQQLAASGGSPPPPEPSTGYGDVFNVPPYETGDEVPIYQSGPSQAFF